MKSHGGPTVQSKEILPQTETEPTGRTPFPGSVSGETQKVVLEGRGSFPDRTELV